MEPTETICELAERWAQEDESEARSRRFALKLERLAPKLGLSRHALALRFSATTYAAWLATQAAA